MANKPYNQRTRYITHTNIRNVCSNLGSNPGTHIAYIWDEKLRTQLVGSYMAERVELFYPKLIVGTYDSGVRVHEMIEDIEATFQELDRIEAEYKKADSPCTKEPALS